MDLQEAQSQVEAMPLLRVKAEGARGLAAAGGLLGAADKKPDPYVVFSLGGATRRCAHVDDVEPLAFFEWPSAEAEFPVDSEAELTAAPLVVHVKDKDLVKDRFIGGAVVDLGKLLGSAGADEGNGDRVLCKSQMVPLEFADEKHKTKSKQPGEVKLTIVLVDPRAKDVEKKEKPQTSEIVGSPTQLEETQRREQQPKSDAEPSYTIQAKKVEAPISTNSADKAPELSNPKEAILAPSKDVQSTVSNVDGTTNMQSQDPDLQLPAQSATSSRSTPTESLAAAGALSPRSVLTPAKDHESKPLDPVSASTPTSNTSIPIKRLHIELVSAKNLTRPTSLGALFDRKPDPFVVLDFAGMTMASTPLKDVDIKQPVQWNNAILSFDMPRDLTLIHRPKGVNPADLIIHVKDENLTKPTYMGGTKASLEEFFLVPTSNRWTPSPAAVSGVERVYLLVFGDEKLKKRKECGEITLRFRFELEEEIAAGDRKNADCTPSESKAEIDVSRQQNVSNGLPMLAAEVTSDKPPVSISIANAAPEEPQPDDSQPAGKASLVIAMPIEKLCTDIQSLSVEVLCARQLKKPTAPSGLIKGALKAVFDRKPDPYVILTLQGHPAKKTPVVKDADVAFVEWKNAVQAFEFNEKPYPVDLLVHVRDHDTVGADPFMGGTRIQLEPVWKATTDTSTTPELVKTYPLEFADEQMTKHQSCGEITLRFHWVYATEPLIVAAQPLQETKTLDEPPKLTNSIVPRMEANLLRYMCFNDLRLVNNPSIISTSHDLYVEISCLPHGMAPESSKQRVMTSTGVLTDATKGLAPDGIVEWAEDKLVLPVVIPIEQTSNTQDIVFELKDKNAITKDGRIAQTTIPLSEVLALRSSQESSACEIAVNLAPMASGGARGKMEGLKLALTTMVSLVQLESPELIAPQSEAAIMTFFALYGNIKWGSSETPLDKGMHFGLYIQIAGAKPSKGLLSVFSRPHDEDHIDFYPLSSDLSVVEWCAGFDTLVSSKQLQTAREKESLDLDIQLWCVTEGPSGKRKISPTMVSSYQLSVWEFLSYAPSVAGSSAIKTIEFPLGHLGGTMLFSYSTSFRKALIEATRTSKASSQHKEPLLSSGNLHLLVLYAQDLVPPVGTDEKAGELDPEVRVAIEPKYVKRKENPVRAMLKTRPIEDAGVTPTWNEYLRLEYRLPSASSTVVASAIESDASASATGGDSSSAVMPAPIVTVGVYDIQIPGERNGSAVIGKAELPLSAFVLPRISPSVMEPLPFYTTVDLVLGGKKTGRLTFEGVFEPILTPALSPVDASLSLEKGAATSTVTNSKKSEDDEGPYRILCRNIGRSLKDKAKQLRAADSAPPVPAEEGNQGYLRPSTPGRLEVRIERAIGGSFSSDNGPLMAHLWVASAIEDRKEVQSRSRVAGSSANVSSEQQPEVEWDSQVTLYTSDVATDILRVELLSMTGKSLGSLKQPVNSVLSNPNGKMIRESYQMIAPIVSSKTSSAKKNKNASTSFQDILQLGIAFYPDQQIHEPLINSTIPKGSTEEITSIFLQCGRFIFADSAISDIEGSTLLCKAAFFGSTGPNGVAPAALASKANSVKVVNAVPYVDWDDELLCIELECSASTLIASSYAIGACPIVRIELLLNRKEARFSEVIVTYEISITGLLRRQCTSLTTWATFYTPTTSERPKGSLIGVMRLGVAAYSRRLPRSTNPFSQVYSSDAGNPDTLTPLPGILCLRFVAGRNLTDVDANGEQDPYVVARVQPLPRPIRGLDHYSCQTSVSLNGGRHPQWNSPVFYLNSSNMWTDYLRLEVVDSNEEDHIPDASIGTLSIALATLFNKFNAESSNNTTQGKTPWEEAWLPIYSLRDVSIKESGLEAVESAGDIRVEYRFISQEYFKLSQLPSPESTFPSLYSAAGNETDPIEVNTLPGINGSIYLNIIAALDLPCVSGAQPAVRITCPEIGFVHLTPAGKQSIRDPVWGSEIVEIPILSAYLQSATPIIFIEIVDLAIRTANVNALAVITFGSVKVDAFIRHPTATSYGFYKLGNASQTCSCLFLGCQFIPTNQLQGMLPFTSKLSDTEVSKLCKSGQIHIKAVQLRFELLSYFRELIMCTTPKLRFKLLAVNSSPDSASRFGMALTEKVIPVPQKCTSILDIVSSEGYIEWTTLGKEEVDAKEGNNVILFDWKPEFGSLSSGVQAILHQRANPILICELVLDSVKGDVNKPVVSVIGELELPLFDFVLLEGHLLGGWYPLTAPKGNSEPTAYLRELKSSKCAELKLEIQFLPTLVDTDANKVSDSKALTTESIDVLEIHIDRVKEFQGARSGIYTVSVEFLGCSAETKPPISVSTNSLVWDETLDLALSANASIVSKPVNFMLRNLSNPEQKCLAACNWVLPGELSFSQSESIVLQLFDPDRKQQSSSKECIAELILNVRKAATYSEPRPQTITPTSLENQRRGVLYAFFNRPKSNDKNLYISAAFVPSTYTQDALMCSNTLSLDGTNKFLPIEYERFSGFEVTGISTSPQKKFAVVVRPQPSDSEVGNSALGYAEINDKVLRALESKPRVEIFQRIPVHPLLAPSNPQQEKSATLTSDIATSSLPSTLSARLVFLNVLHGHFIVAFKSAKAEKVRLEFFTKFRVELRLLYCRSAWQKSSFGTWNKQSSRVEWKNESKECSISQSAVKIEFSNENMIAEPMLQLVLIGIATKHPSKGGSSQEDSGARIAFGQLSLLNILTEQDWNGTLLDRPIQLSSVNTSSNVGEGDSIVEVYASIGFIGVEATNDEIEAQLVQTRNEQVLLLAEGTAKLKKTFVVLGGSEETPISINSLKKYLLDESPEDTNDLLAARQVILNAAEQETDGDLDRLFSLLDVNGDGQISWSEYTNHMQTLFALANTAVVRSLVKDQATQPANQEDIHDDDEEEEPEEPVGSPSEGGTDEEDAADVVSTNSISRLAQPIPSRSDLARRVDEYVDSPPVIKKEEQLSTTRKQSVQPPGVEPAMATTRAKAQTVLVDNVNTLQKNDATTKQSLNRSKRTDTKTPSRKPLSTNILDWKVDEVLQWLEEEMELPQYGEGIIRNAVNGRLLLTLSESELESELGVTATLHKRKLVTHIAELQEVADYPPLQRLLEPSENLRSNRTRALRTNTTETPSFIRREQLLYQTRAAAAQPEATPFNTTKVPKKRPAVTTLVLDQNEQSPLTATKARPVSLATADKRNDEDQSDGEDVGESFVDAMQDILEAVGPSTPKDTASSRIPIDELESTSKLPPTLPKLPLIQVGSITSTDELFEIVKNRIHQLADQLRPLQTLQDSDSFSDFGESNDGETNNKGDEETEELTGLRLAFNTLANSHAKEAKLSRLRFQKSLLSVLAVDASWHQFDLLFRRVDVNNNAELSFQEFQSVFRRAFIGFEPGDLAVLQDALVDFVIDRLDSQQWTLLELFKAFDRDGGGKISVAEFGTLVRFLFGRAVNSSKNRGRPTRKPLANRQIYLLLSCIDVSSDHRIAQQEFLRFFFVVWSTRLMEVQDELFHLEQRGSPPSSQLEALHTTRRRLRRALRTNFSRPFRDAMRCLDVRMPSPFTGLLSKLQLLAPSPSSDPQESLHAPVQVWQVLKGEQPASGDAKSSTAPVSSSVDPKKKRASGRNEVLRARLTRQRAPAREGAELRAADATLALHESAALKRDRRLG